MGDDWFGHRDPLTGEELGDREEWTSWDWALSRALQTVEDFTDKNGLLIYEVHEDEDRVYVDAERRIDKFDKAVKQITSAKKYKERPGEYFVPSVHLVRGVEEWPTLEEYIDLQIKKAQEEEEAKAPQEYDEENYWE